MISESLAHMDHRDDPRKEILEKVEGYIPQVCQWKVLVAIYVRSEKTKGGIYLTDKLRDEDIYQGKVGLVIGLGPLAFKDDEQRKFHPDSIPKIGDWVLYGSNEGRAAQVNKQAVRFLDDTSVLAIIPSPNGYL